MLNYILGFISGAVSMLCFLCVCYILDVEKEKRMG